MKLCLTFDDGPSEWTPAILDTLAEHDARATFFVCGAHLLDGGYRHVVRAYADGHQIGNHTTSHPDLSALTPEQVRHELGETAAMVAAVMGEMPAMYRAPYLRPPAEPQPFVHVGADVIPQDWREADPSVLADRVLAGAADGSIVLLHDGRPPGQPVFADGGSLDTRGHVVEAVAILVPALKERGFDLVTVAELL